MDVRADVLDVAEKLVPGTGACVPVRDAAVGPEIRPADACVHDTDDGVGRCLDTRIGDVLDANITGAVKDGCAHERRGYPVACGPDARIFCTDSNASRKSPSQLSAFLPTRRTHQASASLRDRATPASTNVSSTRRSPWRSRVITGTDIVVNSSRRSLHWAPHATFRPKRCSASRAIATRTSRVSSRKALIRPAAAAARSTSLPASVV